MRYLFLLFVATLSISLKAQSSTELSASGFAPVTLPVAERPLTHLMEIANAWAANYNKKEYDIYDVTTNTISVDARRDDAFFYRNRGEKYTHDIVYSLKVTFNEDQTFTMQFSVKEIYANKVLLKTTVADFFAPDGRLKSDYIEAKETLDRTANKIMSSFAAAVSRS
jgi:hypothetical protein